MTSAKVVALTEGVLKSMFLNQLKIVTAFVGFAALTLAAFGLASACAPAEPLAAKEEAGLPSLVAALPAHEPAGAAQGDFLA